MICLGQRIWKSQFSLRFPWANHQCFWFFYSNRFATRTTRRTNPHPENRIEGNGAGVVGPTKADWGQTGAQLGRNLRRTRASWLQLRPSLRAQDKTNVGNMPNQSQKTFEIAVRMQVFSLSRWVRKIGRVGPGLPPKAPNLAHVALSWTQLEPKLAPMGQAELKLGPNRSGCTPNWSHMMRMEVQDTFKVAQLAYLWRQLRRKLGPTETH